MVTFPRGIHPYSMDESLFGTCKPEHDQLWLQQGIISHGSAQGCTVSLQVSNPPAGGGTANHISCNSFFCRLVMVKDTNRKGEMTNNRELLAWYVYPLGCEDVRLVLIFINHHSFIMESLHIFFTVMA